ncbi:DUF1748-domain-containing protein [Lentinus tigrinus ALCF2SS1-7]|uniref:DUF1748-domain-containing protein n=1 Tax=Lentinus tigrinus ALCF2SS1-7 TaxID=1328758 RepID=UPI0011663FBF|nr:DUF1748-domain-containing protein [Lentinus tigrinus ALCF2SS1-7]
MIGRAAHYIFDAALVSTLLAGVRRSSGFTVETNKISDDTLRSATEKYLGFGETVFDMIQGTVVNSPYFKRDSSS